MGTVHKLGTSRGTVTLGHAATAYLATLDHPLVPRYVDEAENEVIGHGKIGKSQVDGDPAQLLFLESIGIDPGQRLDEGRLAVVDMTCRADDQNAVPLVVARSATPENCKWRPARSSLVTRFTSK